MSRFRRQFFLASGFVMGLLPAVRADEASSRPASTIVLPAEAPRGHVSVLVRNLWDILWDVRRPMKKTAETPYDWKWLAARCDRDGNGIVTHEEFPGSKEMFARLDRNWDGKLTREDFDWGDTGTLTRQKETVFALFKSIDTSSNGRISADEWQAAFAKAAREKGYLTDEDLEELIYAPSAQRGQMIEERFGQRAMSRSARLRQLFESGRLFSDGPRPGEMAPDFTLRSPDGKNKVQLSSLRGPKPVVLIFGSFT